MKRLSIILVGLLALAGVSSAVSRVGGATNSAAGNSPPVVATYTPTAGNCELAVVETPSASVTVSSIAQTNCTWVLEKRYQASSMSVEIWACLSAGSSPGTTETVTFSAAPGSSTVGRSSVCVEEYNAASTGLDVASAGAAATTTTTTGAAVTTTNATDVLVCGFVSNDGGSVGGTSFTSVTSGYAQTRIVSSQDSNPTVFNCALIDQIVTSTQPSAQCSATISLGTDVLLGVMAAMKFPSSSTNHFLSCLGCGS